MCVRNNYAPRHIPKCTAVDNKNYKLWVSSITVRLVPPRTGNPKAITYVRTVPEESNLKVRKGPENYKYLTFPSYIKGIKYIHLSYENATKDIQPARRKI